MNRDFRDLFCALNDAGAEYLLVGGYAVMHYAEPRFTKDLDILVRPTGANARRVLRALESFGAPIGGVSPADLADPELILQIGVAPNRIDILMKIKGVAFASAWKTRVSGRYADQQIWVIDERSLERAKRAAGRPQDLADLAALRAARRLRR